jgi:6-phosphogluconolactonase
MNRFPLVLAVATAALSNIAVHADTLPVWFGTGSSASKGIYHATLSTKNGKLSKPTVAAEIKSPGFLDAHPDGSMVYAVCRLPEGESGVAAYAIDGDSLTFLNGEPIGDGGGAHVGVHPSGKFLMTAQYGGNSVAVFPLAGDGKVEARSQLIEHEGGSGVVGKRQDKPHPHYCGYDPAGNFAFVPDLGMDGIVIYKVNDDKSGVTRHGFAKVPAGGGPRHMKFSPDAKFAYVLNELALSVSVFAYDTAQGNLTLLQTIPTLSEKTKAEEVFNSASEVRLHPSGKFLYTANRGHDSITAFSIDPSNGKLSLIEVESIRGAWPRNFNLDPSGQWLLAAGAQSNTISVFAIDPESGELTFQRGNIINVPGAICVLFP